MLQTTEYAKKAFNPIAGANTNGALASSDIVSVPTKAAIAVT